MLKAGEPRLAVDLFAKAGKYARVGEAYEAAGMPFEAKAAYARARRK